MKKLLSLLLTAAMLLSCCMIDVFAEDVLLIAPAETSTVLLEDDMRTNEGTTTSMICHGASWHDQFKLFDSGENTFLVYTLTVPATKGAVATVEYMDWDDIGNGGVHLYSSLPKYLCYVTTDEIDADFDGNVEDWTPVEANEEIDRDTFTYTYDIDGALGYDAEKTVYICFKFNPNDVSYAGQSGWNDGAWIEKIAFTATDYTGILLYDGQDQDVLIGGTPDDETTTRGSDDVAAVCKDFTVGSSVDPAGIMAQINLAANEQSLDVSGMDFFRFDIYVEDFTAASTVQWCVELTSSGTYDQEEHQYLGTFAGLGAGWNTVTLRLGSFQDKGMDLSRFNYFRLFNDSAISGGSDFVFKIDNVRFEKAEEIASDYTGPVEEYLFIVLDNDSELDYLVNSSASVSGTAFRFCDGNTEVVYKYSIINRYSVNQVLFTAMLSQQLLLEVSQNGSDWTTVYAYEYDPDKNPDQGMGWNKTMTFDLTAYVDLAANPDLYIRVGDSYPSNGWGGTIHSDIATRLEVRYTELTPEQWDAFEGAPDERSISLLTGSKPFGKFAPDTTNKTSGYSSASLKIIGDNVNATTFDAIDGSAYDALEFDMYVIDPAMFEATYRDTGIELSSAGKCDDGELSWKFSDIVSAMDGKIETGWNHVTLLFRDGKPDDRNVAEFNAAAINYFRFFFVGTPEEYHGDTFALDNIRLTKAAAERDAAQALADQKAADQVINLIDKIGEVTDKSERNITRAQNGYNDLTDAQKALVTNYDVLEAAIAKYEELLAQPDEPPQTGDPVGPTDPEGSTGNPAGSTDDPQKPQDEPGEQEPATKTGCGGVLSTGASVMLALGAAWVTWMTRKKED